MDNYYERLNQAFANWNGGEPSLDDRVAALESEMLQKQDILTFDFEPVEDSENPVTSGGLFSQFEGYATKTALNEKVDTSNFTIDQDRQDALEAEDRAALVSLIDGGAKNSFDIQHPSTARGTEYNATSDGGVELTCSNAAWTQYIIKDIPIESGREYNFTLYVDEISGTDALRMYVRETNSSGNLLYDSNNISTVKISTATITPSSDKIWVGIYLNNSATPRTASAKIRAMICTAADYTISPAFVPYRPSWQEMYDMIKALQSGS